MGSNREKRTHQKSIHVFLAFKRKGTNKDHRCMRQVIRNYNKDLEFLKMRCKTEGGTWRIHRTVNPRDPVKAMKFLMKKLIDHPELCSNIDQEWRNALLQPECIYGDKEFMFDIDQEDISEVEEILKKNKIYNYETIKSPKGWHLITMPFDTREICKFDYVSLLRDGYFYIETVSENE